jgi:PAS domain S-box/diguanylate cyclase (GGDEF) domain
MATLAWSLLLVASFLWNSKLTDDQIINLAATEAKSYLQKDLAFRKWATKMGGLYVKVTPDVQPNEFLSNLPHRDVVTNAGDELTLYNPAIVLRLLMETQQKLYGIKSRITGEQVLNPINTPDAWESKALSIIKNTKSDYSELVDEDGEQFLRVMQPMIQQEGCLKCHAWTGIPVGELRGGTDVSIPLKPIRKSSMPAYEAMIITHASAWLLGVVFFLFISTKSRGSIIKDAEKNKQLYTLNLAVEQTASGIVITDDKAEIEYTNDTFAKITGYNIIELVGKNHSYLSAGKTDITVYENLWETITNGRHWRGELLNKRKTGEEYWCSISITPIKNDDGKIIKYISITEDITERKLKDDTIKKLASYDPLTSLANRRLLTNKIKDTIAVVNRYGGQFAIFYIDIDEFKTINDTMGHHIGDEILKVTSARLLSIVREVDTVARLGGDEFAILFNNTCPVNKLDIIAQKILNKIREPIHADNKDYYISCSIGASLFPTDSDTIEKLLSNADMAMYHAKSKGKDNFQYFNESLNADNARRMKIQSGLKTALEKNEFSLVYQPKIDIALNEIYGVEALLRWESPVLGSVSPMEFIPIAEDSGEISRIGAWVLRHACKQAKHWENEGVELLLSVNISAVQLRTGNLFDLVTNILEEEHYNPHLLELEVTETAIMAEPDKSTRQIEKLRNIGVSISIDDFGTGYSSLGQLKNLPANILKIDKSFITSLTVDEEDVSIVRAIITLAQSLNLKVIAEGVETQEHFDILSRLGCNLMQGYLFSKPILPDEIIPMVNDKTALYIQAT